MRRNYKMVFSDLLFLFVFIPFFIVTYLIGGYIDRLRIKNGDKKGKNISGKMLWRNISLIIFSILFYSWGEPVYILLMIFAVIANYCFGLLIDKLDAEKFRKISLIIGVAINLCILGSFKYLGFFGSILQNFGLLVNPPIIALPIGISFYIFQSISYLVDVYRRESPVQRNIFSLLLYIAMFPQLIAGPIVRYGSVATEINDRNVSLNDVAEGVYRFIIGLGEKVILANILGEIATQLIGGNVENLGAAAAWVGIIAFTLQIYFDFSGYSNMAIGLGLSVGFHFPENFNHPYISRSLTEFWRRWHMSLGSFFRDYVYIPMGGNRRRQILNIMTVWFLTGMWHGASWNFILWGLYFGLIVLIEKYTILKWKIPVIVSHIYSIFIIIVGWGIFYFDDIGKMGQFFKGFFGLNESAGIPIEVESAIFDNFWIWIAAIILCMPVREFISKKAKDFKSTQILYAPYGVQITRTVISMVILAVSVVLLVGATNNAFLYTRF